LSKKRIGLVSAAVVVFVVVFVAFAGTALAAYDWTNHATDKSMVVNSPHDVNAENPCSSCHIPHGANGDFLWARDPSTSTAGASDVTSNDDAGISTAIKPMCYSCHDGTIASVGLVTAFSATHTNHRTRAATAIRASTGLPYGPGRDCDLCHDPHDDGNTKFLKYERSRTSNGVTTWTPITPGGNVCASCHSGNADMATNHPIDVVPSVSSYPTDQAWVPAVGDYSGTRLYDPTTHLVSAAATAQINCLSCHAPHGADPDALAETETGTVYHSINTMATGAGELCLNCHAN
jgi:hypothetical protein